MGWERMSYGESGERLERRERGTECASAGESGAERALRAMRGRQGAAAIARRCNRGGKLRPRLENAQPTPRYSLSRCRAPPCLPRWAAVAAVTGSSRSRIRDRPSCRPSARVALTLQGVYSLRIFLLGYAPCPSHNFPSPLLKVGQLTYGLYNS